jgi:hypothetical protein
MDGEDSFQRHENHHQQQEPDGQAEEVYSDGKEITLYLFETFHPN